MLHGAVPIWPRDGHVECARREVVGEGWHARKGEPHAESHALAAAGESARGSTLYVTLEPCTSWGETPPCAAAVVEAGIARVVVGARDPNPNAAGGVEYLREAGVEVELADGELGFRARQQNEAWLNWITKGRPFVTYKAAVTLDGRMTLPGSRWISGEESRRLVHELRAGSDAVAVGMRTARMSLILTISHHVPPCWPSTPPRSTAKTRSVA